MSLFPSGRIYTNLLHYVLKSQDGYRSADRDEDKNLIKFLKIEKGNIWHFTLTLIEVAARHYVLDTLKVGLTDNLY
ncbi:MAG TPA: hypothetical protein VK553_00400 [Candidatus Nitrosopolaris rasttigaisensis]|nr:hypothetical protein [Candidatus Nitrosopolaris rasttigaisensis]